MSTQSWRLYADAGNLTLKWAAHDGTGWLADSRIAVEQLTRGEATPVVEELELSGLDEGGCEAVTLVSSRPSLTATAERALREATGANVAVLGRDLHADVEVTYYDPGEIGQDRLAAAEGALALAGAPAVVIALGTCLTVQALDATGRMVGGAIAPGLHVAAWGMIEAVPHLAEATETALAAVRSHTDERGLGNSSVESIALGLRCAMRGTIEELIEVAAERVGTDASVIATGGDVSLAQALGVQFDRVEPLLVLEGLRAVDVRER